MGEVKALLWCESQKIRFSKVRPHFQMKLTKKSKFKSFTASSLTLLAHCPAGRRGAGVCRGQSPLSCKHICRSEEK